MQLEPGMRVRCVIDKGSMSQLQCGEEYRISMRSGPFVSVDKRGPHWFSFRFKPIVRVKAPCVRVVA
jgi:hypothetical protein